MGASAWECPRSFPALGRDEVHVWRSSMVEHGVVLARLRPLLSPEEARQAERFRFERDRDRFTIGRAILRLLVGRYQALAAGAVTFSHGPQGKPFLPACGPPLEFNVSHSDDLALFAFARGRRVGVDIEAVRPAVAREDIPERFFTAEEAAFLRALPPERQPEAFFDCWVRKEAAIKAWGVGLSLALDRFTVGTGECDCAELECPREAGDSPSRWSMRALDAGSGYRAALVFEGRDCSLRRLCLARDAFA
jgi:4'-phosphopantetheinyl transferase